MSAEPTTLLILANSGRAMAESAFRGGFSVTVLDGFCDQDTMEVADCWPICPGFSRVDADLLLEEIATLFPAHPCGLVYGAGLEEAPTLLQRLSGCCRLYGNDPAVLDMLRSPSRFFSLLNRLRITYPEVCFTPPYSSAERSWLVKRAGSCGGQGVAYFDPQHSATDASCYFQRYVSGQAMSILFIADGKRHRTIGFNRLRLNSCNAPAPFLYSGAVGQVSLAQAQRLQVEQMVEKLVTELALRGVNSVDFILNEDGIFMLDLNPRPTATLELYEHLVTDGWIKHHIAACQGALPVVPIVSSAVMHGHLIVYSPKTIEIPQAMVWPNWVKDRPSSEARIAEGQPLCSLFAQGESVEAVELALQQYQQEILRMLNCAGQAVSKQRRLAV
jgi:predicted ATP-grasp superfamily ATP-dependent carboligase